MSDQFKKKKHFNIKDWLLEESERLVDLIESLELAVNENDEVKSRSVVEELNELGNKLSDYLPNLTDEDKAFGHFMMGSLCASLRMWPETRYAFEVALDIWPDHVGLLNEYFICLFEQQDFDKAIQIIEKSKELGGETSEIIQNLAVACFYSGKVDRAKMELITAIAKYPDHQELQKTLYEIENPNG